jgi:hypothetical protein
VEEVKVETLTEILASIKDEYFSDLNIHDINDDEVSDVNESDIDLDNPANREASA